MQETTHIKLCVCGRMMKLLNRGLCLFKPRRGNVKE